MVRRAAGLQRLQRRLKHFWLASLFPSRARRRQFHDSRLPVEARSIRPYGRRDRVGDPTVHGGEDKAVHFYRANIIPLGLTCQLVHPHLGRLALWREHLRFGNDRGKKIGDRFRIGEALVEIGQGDNRAGRLTIISA
jgi:hypothetical protein